MRVIGEKNKQLNTLITPELDKELKRYCVENDVKKKNVVVMALELFLANRKNDKN